MYRSALSTVFKVFEVFAVFLPTSPHPPAPYRVALFLKSLTEPFYLSC